MKYIDKGGLYSRGSGKQYRKRVFDLTYNDHHDADMLGWEPKGTYGLLYTVHCTVNIYIVEFFFKGQSNEIFDLQFFS